MVAVGSHELGSLAVVPRVTSPVFLGHCLLALIQNGHRVYKCQFENNSQAERPPCGRGLPCRDAVGRGTNSGDPQLSQSRLGGNGL